MKNILLIFLFFLIFQPAYAEDRLKIFSLVNHEIIVSDHFAGQSFTLIKDGEKYYVLRKFFGSGVPVVNTIKYSAEVESDYQIRFSKIIKNDNASKNKPDEKFILQIEDNSAIGLYLNEIKVVIDNKTK
ncbi:MAG TPA: hypothetical protein PK467_02305 [Candidatus Wallbacteria bacterium]|nr:hypothetical protein [Candidatus Wallbacteria bacterium]